MRHRKDHRQLSRTASHRRALLRNLVTALIVHERIETTVAKAKEARRVAERLVTFAKRGDLAARRHVDSYVMRPEATRKLFDTIAPWYTERHGGYTRIIRIGRRLGDNGETAFLEWVKSEEQREEERQARLAASEEKDTKGDKGDKKAKASRSAGGEGAPQRGSKRDTSRGGAPTPGKKRSRTGVKTG